MAPNNKNVEDERGDQFLLSFLMFLLAEFSLEKDIKSNIDT